MPIGSVRIRNFQSHKDTKIEFDPGVNVVVGSSDQGKSAVLRALLWAINNRPSGTDDILSHWARDAKEKIVDGMSVEIATDRGNVTRRRAEKDNEYVLSDLAKGEGGTKAFKAVSKDVPQDVTDFFRLSDVNVQTKHDAPFLLSASAGDVARYFNRIVRLDAIDMVLGNAEASRRDQGKKIKNLETEKADLEKDLQAYGWIETARPLAEKLGIAVSRIETCIAEAERLEKSVSECREARKAIKALPDVEIANGVIGAIENADNDLARLADAVSDAEKAMERHRELRRSAKAWQSASPGKKVVADIEKAQKSLSDLGNDFGDLEDQISEWENAAEKGELNFNGPRAREIIYESDKIKPDYALLHSLNDQILEWGDASARAEKWQNELKLLRESMPAICPACGQSMKDVK